MEGMDSVSENTQQETTPYQPTEKEQVMHEAIKAARDESQEIQVPLHSPVMTLGEIVEAEGFEFKGTMGSTKSSLEKTVEDLRERVSVLEKLLERTISKINENMTILK